MNTLERYQWCRSSVFIVNCEHISNFLLIVDFEQAHVAGFLLKRKTLLKKRSGISINTLQYFNCEQICQKIAFELIR